jgi:hypothetical protein
MATRGVIRIGGGVTRGVFQRAKTHVLPFYDHAGHPAQMVFTGSESCLLPPLYSFAIYFTHPETSSETVDAAGLFTALRSDNPMANRPCIYRLDIYFLPNAGEEDFVTHYRDEGAARGDYNAQIKAYYERINTEDATGSASKAHCLPGLVLSYAVRSDYDRYHGRLYMCRDRDWCEKEVMLLVKFDPITQEEYESEREPPEPAVIPPLCTVSGFLSEWSPGCNVSSERLGMEMFEVSHRDTANELNGLWREAEAEGWTSWVRSYSESSS